jgi:hypothetical protein
VPHVQDAPARFAHDGKRFGHQVDEGLAAGEPLTELGSLLPERLVAQRLNRGLERVDLRDERAQAFEFAFVLGADDLGEPSGSSTADNPTWIFKRLYQGITRPAKAGRYRGW